MNELFDRVDPDLFNNAVELMDGNRDGFEMFSIAFVDPPTEAANARNTSMIIGPDISVTERIARSFTDDDLTVGYLALDDYNGKYINGVGFDEVEALENLLRKLLVLHRADHPGADAGE